MRKKQMDYSSSDGVNEWANRCGFESNEEAWTALGCSWRTWFRYRAKGLPPGLGGKLIAERMEELESKIEVKRAKKTRKQA